MTATPFTTSRLVSAPRELVYAVHTDAKHLAAWMGPAGFDAIHAAMDFRVGGSYHYGIRSPEGMEMWGKQVFRAIDPGRKLVYLQSFSDPAGGLGQHPMSPTWPQQMLATTTFEDPGPARTLVTITWQPYEADEVADATFDAARPGMHNGFAGTFDKLETYLAEQMSGDLVTTPNDTDLVFERLLDAPRELVWRAHTDPIEVLRWWGPEGFVCTTQVMDVRPGGTWRLIMHGPDGTDYPNLITYLEVVAPSRLVMDHGDFDRVHFHVETDLVDEGGKTRLVTRMRFPAKAVRDQTMTYGVPGHASTMRRLVAWLAANG